jgi:class 3 adenylate cyclase
MTFDDILDQAITILQRRGRVTYRTLKRQFDLDDEALEDLKFELIEGQRLATDENGTVLVWIGETESVAPPTSVPASAQAAAHKPPPLSYTPPYLAEKILTSRSALEGERKQVTVLFADLKGSMEVLADRDPEEARQLLDPVLERLMAAVHRYEGTVNQIMGDGIMALFGAPIAHEDHAVRACYAALAMQEAIRSYADQVRQTHQVEIQIRVGLNSGEVVVRAIGNGLHMDYSAIGQTTHLAARMEQLAPPSSRCTPPRSAGRPGSSPNSTSSGSATRGFNGIPLGSDPIALSAWTLGWHLCSKPMAATGARPPRLSRLSSRVSPSLPPGWRC